MSYDTEVLADSPYVYWKMDDSSGSTMVDSSGNGRSGAYVGSPTLSAAGPPGGGTSVQFNGSQHTTYTVPSDHTGHWTIEFWIRFSNINGQYQGVIGSWSANSADNYGTAFDVATNGNMDLNISSAAFNGWWVNASRATAFAVDTWYHVAVTFDNNSGGGSTKTATLYVNGSQVGATATSTSQAGLWKSGKVFRVASSGGANADRVVGRIAKVAVYHSVLSGARIAAHYAAAASVTVPIDVTNIEIEGHDVAIGVPVEVEVDATSVAITGHDTAISTEDGGVIVVATTSNTAIAGQDVDVLAEADASIDVEEANIGVFASPAFWGVTFQNYNEIMLAAGPHAWYKFANSLANSRPPSVTNWLGNLTGTAGYGTTNPITGTDPDVYLDTGNLESANSFPITMVGFSSHPSAQNKNGTTWELFLRTTASNGVICSWYRDTPQAITATYNDFINGDQIYVEATATFANASSTQSFVQGLAVRNGNLVAFQNQSSGSITTQGQAVGFSSQGATLASVRATAFTNAQNASIVGKRDPQWSGSAGAVNDGQWHHIVVTTVLSGGVYTHKTYLDGVEVFNVGPMLATTYGSGGKFAIGQLHGNWQASGGPVRKKLISSGLNCDIDELALYDKGISGTEAKLHSDARNGFTVSDPSVEVTSVLTNIGVSAPTQTVSLSKTVTTVTTNVRVRERSVFISSDDGVVISSEGSDVEVAGQDTTVLAEGNKLITLTSANNIGIRGRLNFVYATVDDLSFTFVSPDSVAQSASDSLQLESISMGAFLFSQEKTIKFRIGNTSSFLCNYKISSVSSNEEVINNVTYSLDNNSYYDEVETATVNGNEVSEIIWVRLTIPTALTVGSGNFLINVEPINVTANS